MAQAQVQMQIADFAGALGTLDSAVAGATTPIERRTAFYFPRPRQSRPRQLPQAARDFDAALGPDELKGRLGVVLWRYAAQVRGRQDARGC